MLKMWIQIKLDNGSIKNPGEPFNRPSDAEFPMEAEGNMRLAEIF